MRRTSPVQVLLVLVVVAVAVLLVGRTSGDDDAGGAAVPAEVGRTLALADAGGPFPYGRDGVVFMNRERLLPRHPRGFWHEYTVPTPGERDRGARRLVVGRDGSAYYSGDHYASFRRIREARR